MKPESPDSHSSGVKAQPKREKIIKKRTKNPYTDITAQLPKEIREKLDWSKENLDEMCSALTLPNEFKPGLVLKWMKKVSENEINKIHEEFVGIKQAEKKMQRSIIYSMESYEGKHISSHSQRSESSSKIDSERFTATRSRDTPNRVVNYNVMMVEGNSAYSKTSSNTKASPNMVRIPLNTKGGQSDSINHSTTRLSLLEKSPEIVSIVPGKTVLIKFDNLSVDENIEDSRLKCRRNILKGKRAQDIVIENLDNLCAKDIKQISCFHKGNNEDDHSIHALSSIVPDHLGESIMFNWVGNHESQDLN